MSGIHFLQLLELEQYASRKDGALIRNEQETDRGEQCYYASPYSAPSYMRWYRVLDKTAAAPGARGESTRLLAHTMELDCFTFGVKVFVRMGMDGTLKIIAEDAEGREVLATYTMGES